MGHEIFQNPNYKPGEWFSAKKLSSGGSGIPIVDAANRLNQKILIDTLTHCYNLHYFDRFKIENSNLERNHDKIGFIFIDLNDLKTTNDTLGHAAGDALILKTTEYLKSVFRKSDEIVRIGGDEFIIICHNDENHQNFRDELLSRAQAISKASPKSVSFAFGVAVFDKEIDVNLDDTQKRADELMYICKNKMKAKNES